MCYFQSKPWMRITTFKIMIQGLSCGSSKQRSSFSSSVVIRSNKWYRFDVSHFEELTILREYEIHTHVTMFIALIFKESILILFSSHLSSLYGISALLMVIVGGVYPFPIIVPINGL